MRFYASARSLTLRRPSWHIGASHERLDSVIIISASHLEAIGSKLCRPADAAGKRTRYCVSFGRYPFPGLWALMRRTDRNASNMCDLEGIVITLLPNREPATAPAWLCAHPRIAIARDRGGGYGEAPTMALPNAVHSPTAGIGWRTLTGRFSTTSHAKIPLQRRHDAPVMQTSSTN